MIQKLMNNNNWFRKTKKMKLKKMVLVLLIKINKSKIKKLNFKILKTDNRNNKINKMINYKDQDLIMMICNKVKILIMNKSRS